MSKAISYVRADDVKVGDTLICDGSFTCMPDLAEKVVRSYDGSSELEQLYVACDHGTHGLEGQLDYTDETEGVLVGFTKKAA